MTLSLNEIESTAKKAARGGGYPWGLAEEAASATRWLHSNDLDGCAALASLLDRVDGQEIASWSPNPCNNVWSVEGMLCPIAAGAAISDRAQEIAESEIRLGPIAQPILLAPFAAHVAQTLKKTITVRFDDTEASTDGEKIRLSGVCPKASSWAWIGINGSVDQPNRKRHRARPDAAAWNALVTYAHRTYAPATEESRLRGAGAGLSDND